MMASDSRAAKRGWYRRSPTLEDGAIQRPWQTSESEPQRRGSQSRPAPAPLAVARRVQKRNLDAAR